MKLLGYCTECHRIKNVTVKGVLGGKIEQGICDNCATKENGKAKTV